MQNPWPWGRNTLFLCSVLLVAVHVMEITTLPTVYSWLRWCETSNVRARTWGMSPQSLHCPRKVLIQMLLRFIYIVIAWLKSIPDSMMVLDADLLGVLIISLPETLGGKIERRFLSIAHRYLTDEYLTKLWQSQPSWCQKGFMELESKCVSQEVQQISTHYTVPFTTLDPAFLLSIVLPCILDSSEWCIIKHWWNWFG